MCNPSGDGDFHDVPLSNTSDDSIQQSPRGAKIPEIGPAETRGPSNTSSLQEPGVTTPAGRGASRSVSNPGSPAYLEESAISQLSARERLGFRRGHGHLRNPYTPRNDWRPGQPDNSPWVPPFPRNPTTSHLTPPHSAQRGGEAEASGPTTTRPSTSGGELSTAPSLLPERRYTSRPRPPFVRYSATDEILSFMPREDQSVLSDPFSTDELTFTAEQASEVEPSPSSPSKIPSYIHPVSEGGSVTWKDHNDLVYFRGKDRGPRIPAPKLPTGYRSKGPLKNFDFDKLRQSRGRNAPVLRFQEEYEGKQKDQTPTSLVTEIVSYYVTNEDEHLSILMRKATENQALSFKIRAQELEIKKLKDYAAQAVVAEEQKNNIEELNETNKKRDGTIDYLRSQINKINEGTYNRETMEDIEENKALMVRIIELEAELQTRKRESSPTSRNPESAKYEERINDLLIDVNNKQDTIDNLIVTIKELEEGAPTWGKSSMHSKSSITAVHNKIVEEILTSIDGMASKANKQEGETIDSPQALDRSNQGEIMNDSVFTIDDLDEVIRQRKEEISELSQNLDKGEGEESIQDLQLAIDIRDKAITDLQDRIRSFEAESTTIFAERSRLAAQLNKLSTLIKKHQATINHLVQRNHDLEEVARTQIEISSAPTKDTGREAPVKLTQLIQERENSVGDLLKRNTLLETAERVRQEVRAAIFPSLPPIRKMIETAKAIKAVSLESLARVILLKVENNIKEKEYPAAGKEAERAEDIIRKELPHLSVLEGKCMYMHGRAMFESGFLPEAIKDFKGAGRLGFDRNCGDLDGDCVLPLLMRARKKYDEAVASGEYLPGADLGPE